MQTDYPYLPEGRTFKYVPITDPFMAEAKNVALTSSTDSKQPTSVVLVKGGKIIGTGANASLLRKPWMHQIHSKYCIRKLLHIKSGTKYYLCPGCASSHMHAEPRGIADARRRNEDTNGADIYHWGHWWCCKPCWDAMIEAGIKDVYLVEGATAQFKR